MDQTSLPALIPNLDKSSIKAYVAFSFLRYSDGLGFCIKLVAGPRIALGSLAYETSVGAIPPSRRGFIPNFERTLAIPVEEEQYRCLFAF